MRRKKTKKSTPCETKTKNSKQKKSWDLKCYQLNDKKIEIFPPNWSQVEIQKRKRNFLNEKEKIKCEIRSEWKKNETISHTRIEKSGVNLECLRPQHNKFESNIYYFVFISFAIPFLFLVNWYMNANECVNVIVCVRLCVCINFTIICNQFCLIGACCCFLLPPARVCGLVYVCE